MTRREFLAAFHTERGENGRTPDHDYGNGSALMASVGGEIVSVRRGTDGRHIETWRVRCSDKDALMTWGYPGVIDRNGVELPPTWRYVPG